MSRIACPNPKRFFITASDTLESGSEPLISSPLTPNPYEDVSDREEDSLNCFQEHLSDEDEPMQDMDEFWAELEKIPDQHWDFPLDSDEGISDLYSPSLVQQAEEFPQPQETFTLETLIESDRRISPDGYILSSVFREGFCNVLKAQMGSGKTEAAAQYVRDRRARAIRDGKPFRLLIVVPRKSLATTLAFKFDCVDYQVVHPGKYRGDTSYVVCINSLPKISKYIGGFDLVILDEISGSIGNIHSSTMGIGSDRSGASANLAYLINPLKVNRLYLHEESTKTVFVMDASFGDRETQFLKDVVPHSHLRFVFYYRSQELTPLPTVLYEPCIYNFLSSLAKEILCTHKKIVIATCAKEYTGVLLKLLSIRSLDFISRLGIDLDTIVRHDPKFCYFDAQTDKSQIQAHLDNQERFRNYDVFIYSPVFVSGISITVRHFDCMFALGQLGTLHAEDFIQMLARVRHLQDNHITIAFSGRQIKLEETPTLETVSHLLETLEEKSKDLRELVYSSLGIHTGFHKGNRGNYRNATRAEYQSSIVSYFSADVPLYQKNLMAHTCLSQLRTRCDVFNAHQQAMALNHPEWVPHVSRKEPIFLHDIGKDALVAILKTHVSELGDIVKMKTQEFLTIQPDSYEEKANKYNIFGYDGPDPEKYEYRSDHLQSSFYWINSVKIASHLMFLSPFSLWYQFVVAFATYGNSCKFDEELSLFQMISGLFETLGWRRHCFTVSVRGQSYNACMIDPRYLDDLVVDTTLIMRKWEPLLHWSETHRMALSLRGVAPIHSNLGDISYKATTSAKNCILGVLGLFGVEFKDKTERAEVTQKNGSKRGVNRIKRKTVSTVYKLVCDRHFEDSRNFRQTEENQDSQLPCYEYRVDHNLIWRTIDVSLRRGLELHLGGDVSELLKDQVRCLGLIVEQNKQSLSEEIPQQVKDAFHEVFFQMHASKLPFMDTPSYWVLSDKTASLVNFNILTCVYYNLFDTLKDFQYRLNTGHPVNFVETRAN